MNTVAWYKRKLLFNAVKKLSEKKIPRTVSYSNDLKRMHVQKWGEKSPTKMFGNNLDLNSVFIELFLRYFYRIKKKLRQLYYIGVLNTHEQHFRIIYLSVVFSFVLFRDDPLHEALYDNAKNHTL